MNFKESRISYGNLLGHGWTLQSSTSVKSSQPLPGSFGRGLIQARSRDLLPPPHDFEHSPHGPKSLEPPSIAITNKTWIYSIDKLH